MSEVSLHPVPAEWAEKALTQNRRFAVALRVLIVALIQRGENDRASAVARDLLAVEPGLTVAGFFQRIPFPRETMAATYAAALRAAGDLGLRAEPAGLGGPARHGSAPSARE